MSRTFWLLTVVLLVTMAILQITSVWQESHLQCLPPSEADLAMRKHRCRRRIVRDEVHFRSPSPLLAHSTQAVRPVSEPSGRPGNLSHDPAQFPFCLTGIDRVNYACME